MQAARAGATVEHAPALQATGVRARQQQVEGEPTIVDLINSSEVDVVINTPSGHSARVDGYEIRAAAVAADLPLFTTIAQLGAAVASFEVIRDGFDVTSLQDYAIQRAERLAAV